jgi:hypothetical protein
MLFLLYKFMVLFVTSVEYKCICYIRWMWLSGVSVAPAGQLSGVVAVTYAELSCDVIWTKITTFNY